MSDRHVMQSLEEAGFSEAQIEALIEAFTFHHHSHSLDEIIGLEDRLEQQLDEITEECEADDDEG